MDDLLDLKTILITGGTGSFGSTVCSSLIETNVKEIRIFSRDEKKQDDMRKSLNDNRVKFQIGDIRDFRSIRDSCADVDYVFHAAALKQVPSCEFYPFEAVKTNILGTENLLNACIDTKVKRVVLLSTDKAVYPINSMGISKAMMEKIMLAKTFMSQAKKTVFCATRYGNVMCSRGSVIPLFVDQIKRNKSITITDPNMTRFLMTLEDAVELVLKAFFEGKSGDIFVQKAPACTINDLADALKKIFNHDKENLIIGTRHGEKLYESLLSREEMAKVIDDGKYFTIPQDNRDLNYEKYFTEGEIDISNFKEYTSHNTQRLSQDQIIKLLLSLDFIKEQLNG